MSQWGKGRMVSPGTGGGGGGGGLGRTGGGLDQAAAAGVAGKWGVEREKERGKGLLAEVDARAENDRWQQKAQSKSAAAMDKNRREAEWDKEVARNKEKDRRGAERAVEGNAQRAMNKQLADGKNQNLLALRTLTTDWEKAKQANDFVQADEVEKRMVARMDAAREDAVKQGILTALWAQDAAERDEATKVEMDERKRTSHEEATQAKGHISSLSGVLRNVSGDVPFIEEARDGSLSGSAQKLSGLGALYKEFQAGRLHKADPVAVTKATQAFAAYSMAVREAIPAVEKELAELQARWEAIPEKEQKRQWMKPPKEGRVTVDLKGKIGRLERRLGKLNAEATKITAYDAQLWASSDPVQIRTRKMRSNYGVAIAVALFNAPGKSKAQVYEDARILYGVAKAKGFAKATPAAPPAPGAPPPVPPVPPPLP